MRVDPIDWTLHALGAIVRPAVYVMLCLPPVLVVVSSLTAGDSLRFPPEGFSLRWYIEAVNSEPFMRSLWISTRLAALATLCSLVLGLCAAAAMDRYEFAGKRAFRALTLSPLIIPMVVLGLGLLQFLSRIGWSQSFVSLLIGHLLITLPYVVRTLTASFALFDRTLEQAAMNLRASPLIVLRRVTLPLIAPSLVSAAVFAFVTSFGNITLSVFLGTANQTTLPVQIFTYVEHSYSPVLAAVSTIVIAVTLAVMIIVEKLTGMEKVT